MDAGLLSFIIALLLITGLMIFIVWPRREPEKRYLVLFKPTEVTEGKITFSDYYSVQICPKCKHILDERKARYDTKCCYICGYNNGSYLFDTMTVIIRDRYINGKYADTIASQ